MAWLICWVARQYMRGAMIDWEAALVEHQRWLRTVVVARVRDRQAVDEVMQELALAIVRHPPQLIASDKVAPWLYRVAVSQSIRYQRTRVRQRRCLERLAARRGDGSSSCEFDDPLRLLLAEERRQLVGQALERLTGRDAEILLLKYTEHWSYRQLADLLGISESAVDGRLQRARARLRFELLNADCDQDQPRALSEVTDP